MGSEIVGPHLRFADVLLTQYYLEPSVNPLLLMFLQKLYDPAGDGRKYQHGNKQNYKSVGKIFN
jgi:hypothetical protein